MRSGNKLNLPHRAAATEPYGIVWLMSAQAYLRFEVGDIASPVKHPEF